MVRKSTNTKGILVADRELRISQYADDATFFIKDWDALSSLFEILNTFASISGLNINYHKSHLLLLGNHLDPPQHFQNMQVKDTVKILGIIFGNHLTEQQQYDLNFAPKINSIREICSTWLNRNLSMKGKVVLIQALMSSLLQYPCSCLVTPTRVIFEFKRIILDFFWNGKRGKVAYNLLIQDIADGGIKLPDLNIRIQTIHLYWIKFMWNQQSSVMATVLGKIKPHNSVQDLLYAKEDLAQQINKKWTFLYQILKTWTQLHLHEPDTEVEIQKEMLWENKFVQINQKTVLWKRWKDNGIVYINDLLHEEESRFLSHTEMATKYNLPVSFLQLLQIRTAIPWAWKRKIQSTAQPRMISKPNIKTKNNQTLEVLDRSAKVLYSALVQQLKPNVTSQGRWNELFPINEENRDEYWADIYKLPYKVARDTKLQAFHFRIVHRFLPCNKFLQNIRIKRDDQCDFCQASDTPEHFLFWCPIVQAFWKEVTAWFDNQVDVQLNISLRAFLFGIPNTAPQAKVVNFLVLFFKFYIYRQKLFHQGSLSLIHVLRELRLRLQVEKHLTTLEGKKEHFKKWQRLYTALG